MEKGTLLLYLGDNLRDFDETFRCSVDNTSPAHGQPTRRSWPRRSGSRRIRWIRLGQKWERSGLSLPNPAYGEWTKPLSLGTKDLDRLVPQQARSREGPTYGATRINGVPQRQILKCPVRRHSTRKIGYFFMFPAPSGGGDITNPSVNMHDFRREAVERGTAGSAVSPMFSL